MVFKSNVWRVFTGVTLIVLAVFFLLSGLRWLKFPFINVETDTLISFVLIVLGMAVLYSGIAGENGEDH